MDQVIQALKHIASWIKLDTEPVLGWIL